MPGLFETFGGAPACRKLAEAFYARVPADPVLRKVYGDSFHCAVGSLTNYLIQYLGGPLEYSAQRHTLSLREAHFRFKIGEPERVAWLANMRVALDELAPDKAVREPLWAFLEAMSARLVNRGAPPPVDYPRTPEFDLEDLVEAIRARDSQRAIALIETNESFFQHDRGAFLGALALMAASADDALLSFTTAALHRDPALAHTRYTYNRILLHDVSASGSATVVSLLLQLGADPNAEDRYGHRPLYFAATAPVVQLLVGKGAEVDARDRVKRTTALHMAARRGNAEVAAALLAAGADPRIEDRSGVTPLQRALNLRKANVAAVLTGAS